MRQIKIHKQTIAAAKAGMNVKTARKYLKDKIKPPGEEAVGINAEKRGRPRRCALDDCWDEIAAQLSNAPGLEAKTVLAWLINKYENKYNYSHLRTLHRRIKEWRAIYGSNQEVIFCQKLIAGRQSQSDFTDMRDLNITISNEKFPHLLFHFMLPYSRWETVSICYSESFDSLSHGYEIAALELGGVLADHRTDNLSAATHSIGQRRAFNKTWLEFLEHYGVKPSVNNPGISHENGSVEKSNDLFKKAVNQQLLMRGSRNFISILEYEKFLEQVKNSRNFTRKERLTEELKKLLPLPDKSWNAPKIVSAKVSPFSTVQILTGTYSVPSRLRSYTVEAYVYRANIIVYYNKREIQTMPRLINDKGVAVNYRHIISDLIRKPGAFENYIYKNSLFPRVIFRETYDALLAYNKTNSHKYYLQILKLAAMGNEGEVAMALELLLEAKKPPLPEVVKELVASVLSKSIVEINIQKPNLAKYDQLLQTMEAHHAAIH